ncbi:DUF3967 domain-containing protein [Bacillus cereus]|nr:hypothetical protein C6351_24710 [Bacillus thuringiensis]
MQIIRIREIQEFKKMTGVSKDKKWYEFRK